jgi:putative ABC transport system ATP-binding protein
MDEKVKQLEGQLKDKFKDQMDMVSVAKENIELPMKIAGRVPDAEWQTRLIEATGLATRLTHKPSELSGGQQQRVAVARALLSRPAVVFGDEPTGNLDSKTSAEVLELLRLAVDDFGQTVIMVTHDASAAAIADRVLFLRDGKIVKDAGRMSAPEIFDTIKTLE